MKSKLALYKRFKVTGWMALVLVAMLVAACAEVDASNQINLGGGDADRGEVALRQYGCVSCHTVPGIRGANATVGPPLTAWADRGYIAGALPNRPANLIRWIQDPQLIEPGTAMPDLQVTESDARDIAAYLYTLRR